MARAGVLTVSDGRRAVHDDVGALGLGVEELRHVCDLLSIDYDGLGGAA